MVKTNELVSSNITGVNQIKPHTNKWAWDLFLKGANNNWMPTDIGMQKDIEQWKSKTITDEERLVLKRCLGFFAGSESLVGNNLLLTIFKYVTDPECRIYIGRQVYEENLHNLTIVYICDSLGLDTHEVYEAYQNIPSIKTKDDFLMTITSDISRNDFKIPERPKFLSTLTKSVSREQMEDYFEYVDAFQELLRNIITYYIICEGIFFYSGFAMLLSFGRQNKFPGIAQQVEYTVRDESLHIQFGTELINRIRNMYKEVWTPEFEKATLEHVDKAVELEIAYANDLLPRGILGLNAPMFIDYMGYIAKRRLDSLGLPSDKYRNYRNPFPWMSEALDLTKNKNFFETTVTDYKVGALIDDL